MLPNLYLIGFMGTGKSVVGRRVSERLGMRFIDSDAAIEARERQPISKLFTEHGEAYFRKLEASFIKEGHPASGCIVSCGGGLAAQAGMMDRLHAKGVVIGLFASPETILERVSRNSNRPLLQVENPGERILEMLEERQPLYLQAAACISTDGRPLSETVDHVARAFQQEVRDRAKEANTTSKNS